MANISGKTFFYLSILFFSFFLILGESYAQQKPGGQIGRETREIIFPVAARMVSEDAVMIDGRIFAMSVPGIGNVSGSGVGVFEAQVDPAGEKEVAKK